MPWIKLPDDLMGKFTNIDVGEKGYYYIEDGKNFHWIVVRFENNCYAYPMLLVTGLPDNIVIHKVDFVIGE